MLSRAIAEKLLLSSRSLSGKCCFLQLHQGQQSKQQQHSRIPIALLQKYCSLYSTATSTSSRSRLKNQHPIQQQKPPPMSWMNAAKRVREPARGLEREAEMKKGLNKEHETITDWPRPSEIPWQSKVANSVNLIGHVHIPVQFEASPDGKYWAGTIISQHDNDSSGSPPVWMPVIFEGDLAHIAACHLKVKDCVCISGQLSSDPPPFTMGQGQANVQVMVHSINYVQRPFPMKKAFPPRNLEQHDESTVDDGDTTLNSWKDLVNNPQKWTDHRQKKLDGLLKATYPDFKHKDNKLALWLNSAPKWVFPKLDGLKFDVQIRKVKQAKECKDDASWNDLLDNPNKWWDNRADKASERSPDFKHKDSGEGLWLNHCPAWVLSRLPPLKSKRTAFTSKRNK